MIVISHRGNISGPNKELENKQETISFALSKGLDVEIDLWIVKDKLMLGHDEPQYETSNEFLSQDGLWIHCKNIEAAQFLATSVNRFYTNFFFHQEDDITLTNKHYLWTYPRKHLLLTSKSIAVMPERVEGWDLSKCAGVCTDYPLNYMK